ncbi:MAG: CoA transferase [Myxococcota bacterium]
MESPQPPALPNRRVLELADGASAYCGKLLADMGADVIKIEPPGGSASRNHPPFWEAGPAGSSSVEFLYLNTGKRSVCLDLDSSAGQERFRELARTADLVVEAQPPGHLEARGLGFESLREKNPRLVLASITGFGQTGPHRHHLSSDLIATAMGGAMKVIGDPEDPPVRLAGAQSEICSSACAAAASLVALRHADRSGRGQHVDVSMQEVVTAFSSICGVGRWLEDGIIQNRAGTGLSASVPSRAYPCRDGSIYLMVNRPAHWKALAQWVHEVTGNEEVLLDIFDGPSSSRLPYRDLLDIFITDLTSQLDAQSAYHEGQRRHIAFTPANTASSVIEDEHLKARNFFTDVEVTAGHPLRVPGAPYRHGATPWRIQRPAPEVGEHDAEGFSRQEREPSWPAQPEAADQGALAGLRVVEFGAGMAVPWLGRFMAWCGAEVIKVESRAYPDVTRLYVPPREPELGIQPQLSPWFTDWNAGKRFVSLDLRQPEAVSLCKRLVGRSDAVIANYSAGVLDKLGLGYATLSATDPELVMLSSNGYGNSGPHASHVTWGPNIESLSGLSTLSGFPHRECTMTHFAYPDPLCALHGLFALMCALEHRARGGGGQYIDLSQFETTLASIGHVVSERFANGREPERQGNRSRHAAPHGCYPCRGDDRWCVIAVENEEQWRALCQALKQPGWEHDARFADMAARIDHADALDALISEWSAQRVDYEVMELLQASGVPAGVVQHTEDLLERDPQHASRAFFETIPHMKKGTVIASGVPLGLTENPGHTPHAGEAIGQDNEYVFRDLLGLSDSEFSAASERGAIEQNVD